MSKCLLPWTKAEDEAIIKAMGTMTSNSTIGGTFDKLTKRLNRSKLAIQGRWYITLSKQVVIKKSSRSKVKKSAIKTKVDQPTIKPEIINFRLEIAKGKYPTGTKVKSLVLNKEGKVRETPFYAGKDIWINGGTYNLKLYEFETDKWAEIISTPNHTESESKPQQKGVFLDITKLESLSVEFLRELAVTKLVDIDKQKLIDIIVE